MRRSLGEIACLSVRLATGRTRESALRGTAATRGPPPEVVRVGGSAVARTPTATPATVGWTPEASIAAHTPTVATTKYRDAVGVMPKERRMAEEFMT